MKGKLLVNNKNVCEIDTDNKSKPIIFNERYKGLKNLTFNKKENIIKCYLNEKTAIDTPSRLVCTIDTNNNDRPVEFSLLFPAFNNYTLDSPKTIKKTEVKDGDNK